MTRLFILTTDKSLFNGIEFIEKIKACIYYENVFFREIAQPRILVITLITLTKVIAYQF